jgi:hypothetical protein
MERIALVTADRFLHLLHLGVALFCVTGWIFPATRLANLVLVILIALSWFGLGKFYGFGYCLITDLQWKIKERLGERPVSPSFVKYQLDRIAGRNLDPKTVDRFTQGSFYLSVLASLYVNFLL